MRYVISARGEAREQYVIEAEDEDAARAMFTRGDLPKPAIVEVYDSEIVSIDAIGGDVGGDARGNDESRPVTGLSRNPRNSAG